MDRLAVVGCCRQGELHRSKTCALLLGDVCLERLRRRPEEERAVDVPTPGDELPVIVNHCDSAIVDGLDKTRAGLNGEQVSAGYLGFALLAPISGDDLVLQGVDHRMELATLYRQFRLDLLETLDCLTELLGRQFR